MTKRIDEAPIRLGDKVPGCSLIVELLCSTCGLPLVEPRQTIDCGCRLCSKCFSVLNER